MRNISQNTVSRMTTNVISKNVISETDVFTKEENFPIISVENPFNVENSFNKAESDVYIESF